MSSNYLIGLGYEKIKAVSFSMSIGTHVSEYYESLNKSGNNYFDGTPFLVYMLERELNALGYTYLQNKLGNYMALVNNEDANNIKSIKEANHIYSQIMDYVQENYDTSNENFDINTDR